MATKQELLDEALAIGEKCTQLQQRVAEAYVQGGTILEAYRKAGGKAKKDATAVITAMEILENPRCKAYMASLRKIKMIDNIMERDEGLSILSDIARTKIQDLYSYKLESVVDEETGEINHKWTYDVADFDSMPAHAKNSIQSVTMTKQGPRFQLMSSAEAIKQIRGIQGWDAPTKTEVSGAGGGALEVKPLVDTQEIKQAVKELKEFF